MMSGTRSRAVLVFLGCLGAAWIGPGCSSPSPQVKAAARPAVDTTGPYVLLASKKAAVAYAAAIAEARQLHPEAEFREFDPGNLPAIETALKAHPPRYAMVFMLPDEIDVNFGWRWLGLTTRLDPDPFVDLRTGFITGEHPHAALALVRRIAQFAAHRVTLPLRTVDNLGPNPQAPKGSCTETKGSFMIPVYAEATEMTTLSHALQGFTAEKMKLLEDRGFVHYGGHGYPDRVVDSLNGPWVRKIRFAPGVFFNGACYTGVTGRWFDMDGPKIAARTVKPGESFCLGVLASGPVAYLAALHPDHGIPVYQEMEFLAFTGATLGEVMKYTHDGVVLGVGGKLPVFEEFADGMPHPDWKPADFMLKGTASRILYGDPSLKVIQPFADPPFEVVCTVQGQALQVTATLRNLKLKSTFTETYYSEMSQTRQFNDRALVTCKLPDGWTAISGIGSLSATSDGQALKAKLIGFGVEQDGGDHRLHVLVDLPSTGYQDGPFRKAGAKVEFTAERGVP